MAKHNVSRDQKRKAKLKERVRKQHNELSDITPYEGRKYQSAAWDDIFFEIESGISRANRQSGGRLTNDQVETAFRALILSLRHGEPAVPAESPPPYAVGQEVPFLMATVRQSWVALFRRGRTVATADLIGILRTLLNSIEAQEWDRGPERGYLDFLDNFIGQQLG